MSVHKVGSALRTISIAVAAIAGLITAMLVYGALGFANPITSAFLCLGMICAAVFLVAGLVHIGEAVYLYQEGLVYADRTSVTAIRFDEIRSLMRITRRSPEAMVGRVSYRITGGGYAIRVSGLVGDARPLGRRLEDAVREHGGLVT
jgi:hypothetical protein